MRLISRSIFAVLTLLTASPAWSQLLTPEQALRRLDDGNARFSAGRPVNPRSDAVRRHETATQGQHPFAVVLTCADSRVPAERIFDQGIGDLFVVRVAGNICANDEAGTIEYGTEHLKAPLLVVLGHTQCGAVKAAISGESLDGSLEEVVANIRPAARTARQQNPQLAGDALTDAAVNANVWHSINDLITGSHEVRQLMRDDRLRVVGAVYDISTGRVNWLGRHPDEADLLKETPGDSAANQPRTRVLGKTVTREPEPHPSAPTAAPTGDVTPDAALGLLREGNNRFTHGAANNPRSDKNRLVETAKGQHPFAAILTCSDSRVPPIRIFDQGFGDVFEVRVAGNVADTTEIGSLEYAAEHLHAPLLVVMGHAGCGAVTAVTKHSELTGHLPKLVDNIEPALATVQTAAPKLEGDALVNAVIRANVNQSINDLRRRSGVIRELEKAGRLKICAAVYQIESGEVEWLDAVKEEPAPNDPASTGGTSERPSTATVSHP